MRHLLVFILLAPLSWLPALAARHALVVGNDSYAHVAPLKNARADARAMAKALEGAGFKVKLALDLNRAGMNTALRQFKARLAGGDEAVFYYAGHGVQLGGTNYLLPIDLQDAEEEQIRDDAVQLQRVLEDMVDRQVRFSLAIIDACRDNPFKGAGRNIGSRGLAPTTAANGQMIIFSAGSGQKALDSLGSSDKSPNGLFTRVFVGQLAQAGVPVHDALRNVREEVVALARSVGHDQVPAIYDQSIGTFYFRQAEREVARPASPPAAVAPVAIAAPAGETPPVPVRPVDDQTALWEAVERGGTAHDYDAYLMQYPKGKFAALAKARKQKLKEQAALAVRQAEQEAWQQAEQGGLPDTYEAYLSRYPSGRYAALAKARAKRLKEDAGAAEEMSYWKSAQQKGRKEDFEDYLDEYPKGRFVLAARAGLQALEKKANEEEAAVKTRELERKRKLLAPIRTIAVLPVLASPAVRLTNRTINPFSLAGKLVNRAEKRGWTESLEKEVGGMQPSIASLLRENVGAALARGGFALVEAPESSVDPANPSKVEYAKVKTSADALVHIYVTEVGFISTTFADAFEPRIEATFCFVRPIEGEKCMEERDVQYGGGVKEDEEFELRSAPEYRWATEEELLGQIDKVKESLAAGAVNIAKLIGDRIAKSQAEKQ